MSSPVLTCTAYNPDTGVCAVQAWVEPTPLLPELTIAQANEIALAFFLALAAVQAVKIASRKSQ